MQKIMHIDIIIISQKNYGFAADFDSDISAFPADIKKSATSLFAPGESTSTKNQLVAEILNRIL